MSSSLVSIQLNKDEKKLIMNYAKTMNVSVSEFVRQAVLEKIEEYSNLKCWDEAKREFDADTETFSLEEIEAKHI